MSEWKKAAIRWIENKQAADGTAVCELIYELDEEPDSLRQMEVPQAALYAGIRRGDAVLVDPGAKQVRAA